MIPPLPSIPILKPKVWGGRAFHARLGKSLPPAARIGESWELSTYGSDTTLVRDGPLAGRNIGQIITEHRAEMLGTGASGDTLPLLYKFIDAHQRLSVQVHPSDEQARAHGWDTRGKTECWYVVAAQAGAGLMLGFRPGVKRGKVAEAVREGRVEDLLNRVDVAAGDVVLVPAGTVHAILEGTLLYEVQESSDATLRLYDWGRMGDDGRPRTLHVAESLEVLETGYHEEYKPCALTLASDAPGVERRSRAACRYFALEEYRFTKGSATLRLLQRGSFQVVTVLAGEAVLRSPGAECRAGLGDTVLIPAELPHLDISGGKALHLLVSWVPDILREVVKPARQERIDDSRIAALGGHCGHNDILPLLSR
jgi:mannose-6-phosphate isomerase